MSKTSWQKITLNRIYRRREETNRSDLPLLSVYRDFGVVERAGRDDNNNKPGEDLNAYRVVYPGDLVLNKMKTWQGSLGVSRYHGIVSPAYFVCRQIGAGDPRFFHHLLRSRHMIDKYAAHSKGIRPSQWDLPWDDFASFEVSLPSPIEQREIADFLDRETTRIDALIEKKQRLIKLLDEHLKCLIDSELRSNTRIPLKYLVWFQEGPGIMAEDFLDEGTPLVRVSGVGEEYVTLDGCNYLDPQKVSKKWAHFALEDGDYVISASATMGVASKVDSEAIGSIPYTGLIRFKPLSDKVEMEFIRYFLVSSDFMHQIDKLKTGAAMQHFGPIHLGQISIPHLAVGDQIRIAGKLVETDRARKEMKDLLVRQISLLEERRRAMITDAVTGVLAIPEVAA